jgi:hypothetical protein
MARVSRAIFLLQSEPVLAGDCAEVSLGLQELDGGASAKLRLEVVGPRGAPVH